MSEFVVDFGRLIEQLLLAGIRRRPVKLVPSFPNLAEVYLPVDIQRDTTQILYGMHLGSCDDTGLLRQSILLDRMMNPDFALLFWELIKEVLLIVVRGR